MSTYCCSDLHGDYKLWTKIKNYCKQNDTIIFLGDAIDRGNAGIKIMQELLDDPRVIYLIGNHEDTFLQYVKIGLDKIVKDKKEFEIIQYNGCLSTFKDFLLLTTQEQNELIEKLNKKLLLKYIYINKEKKKIVLCHAGCDINGINQELPYNDYIWDRNHIQKNTSEWDTLYQDYIVVHGHTPVQALSYYLSNKNIPIKVYKYCRGHKIDIDLGSYDSKKCALLNLDTFKIKYFTS